jgi:RNA polymerase sigma-70 factor (ECF subfamily)
MVKDPEDIIEKFSRVYDLYSDRIFRHLFFRLGDREKALEMMQETFTKTFIYLKDKSIVENIQAYLYRVATNMMIDEANHNKKNRLSSLEALREQGFDPSINHTDELMQRLDAGMILDKLNQLPKQYKKIIILRYVDELLPKEIAEILEISENSVRVKLFRSINKLRKLLKKDEKD